MPADPSVFPSVDLHSRRPSRQATVSEFDQDTGAGAVLYDDGAREEFPSSAFRAGGLRLLRLGQRVRLDYDGEEVHKVTLITMP